MTNRSTSLPCRDCLWGGSKFGYCRCTISLVYVRYIVVIHSTFWSQNTSFEVFGGEQISLDVTNLLILIKICFPVSWEG